MNDEFYQSNLDIHILKVGVEVFTRDVMSRVLGGDSPREIATDIGCTYADIWRWLTEDDDRYKEYQRMLEGTADDISWESKKIADEAEDVPKAKLQVDVRQRLASRWDRNRYGEHTNVQLSGNVSLITLLSSLKDVEEEPELLTNNVIEQLPEREHGRDAQKVG